ncbi:MAG TPA: DUF1697 domain-containing protein [Actinomycetota bacterium]|nr:DUF1697 domain-containing protein [Actinomycetota bacterium]
MARYVALLRGINVGGKNLIRMPALEGCFVDHGFEDVSTYIQSGNVVFSAARASRATLTAEIESMLRASFVHYDASVVVRSASQMRSVVANAPPGFGRDPAKYRYDVIFLKPPLTATVALRDVPLKQGVDAAAAGSGVLYHWRLTSRATQSRLSRVVAMPMYQNMTIRNWNTTTKLEALVTASAA